MARVSARFAARILSGSALLAIALGCGGVRMFDRDPDLEVGTVEQTRVIDYLAVRAESGSYFLVLGVEVVNNAENEDFAVTAAGFELETTSGIIYDASDVSNLVGDACPDDQELGRDASVACTIVFEVEEEDTFHELRFVSPAGRKGRADVDLSGCVWCDDGCVDLQVDPDNCGGCEEVVPTDQVCVAGKQACLLEDDVLCDGECVDLKTDGDNCGACGVECPMGTTCKRGEIVCNDDLLSPCEDGCEDLAEDVENCGACGRECGGTDPWCVGGNACQELAPYDAGTCADICAAVGEGYQCEAGNAWYRSTTGADCDAMVPFDCDAAPEAQIGQCELLAASCDCWLHF